jgi:hypothetical protein
MGSQDDDAHYDNEDAHDNEDARYNKDACYNKDAAAHYSDAARYDDAACYDDAARYDNDTNQYYPEGSQMPSDHDDIYATPRPSDYRPPHPFQSPHLRPEGSFVSLSNLSTHLRV